jgi:hypothetical protein
MRRLIRRPGFLLYLYRLEMQGQVKVWRPASATRMYRVDHSPAPRSELLNHRLSIWLQRKTRVGQEDHCNKNREGISRLIQRQRQDKELRYCAAMYLEGPSIIGCVTEWATLLDFSALHQSDDEEWPIAFLHHAVHSVRVDCPCDLTF